RADTSDQPRIGAPVHRRSARPADEPQGRVLVRSVRVASADAGENRGPEADGVRAVVIVNRGTQMRQLFVVLSLSAASVGAVLLSAQGDGPSSRPRLRGFSAEASAAEIARERELEAMPSAAAAEADFDVMTAEPHHAGSPYEIKLAEYVAGQLTAF